MKLKNSLQMSAIFPIVLAIVVSLSFYMRSQQISNSTGEFKKANAVVELATELNTATYDCVINPGEESYAEWQKKFDALLRLTREIGFNDQGTQIIFERMQVGLKRLEDRFASFVAKQNGTARVQDGIDDRLAGDSRSLAATAFEVAGEAASRTTGFQENLDILFAAFIGILGLVMAASTLAISGDVVRRITRLNEWIRNLPEKEYDRKLKVASGEDEIARLAGSFLEMVGKLRRSRDDFEADAEKHRRAAEALRHSNTQLSGAIGGLKRAQEYIVKKERERVLEEVAKEKLETCPPAAGPPLAENWKLET